MKKIFLSACMSIFCSLSFEASFAQPAAPVAAPQSPSVLVEKVVRKGKEIIIPYEKYRLANGLTLIIHEDHSDPIVHVDVTYHVGSAREEIGKSGFAHFFEHMMFQGSDHVGDDQHFKIVSEAGGTLNGSTNTDRTNYFETMPSNQLETAMWLEADRMGFLLDAVTQAKFENQRSTVKNERGQNYDNRPYGLAHEKISQALYPYGHPYSWLTIGYIEDLNRSDVNDLKKFFLRWYGPNNATLTVAGDVNKDKVIEYAVKYFGPIAKCPEVKAMPKTPVVLDKDRYISYEDNIRFPMISINFPGVPSSHQDEPALDVLAEIIGGGKNSILYKNMIKTQKAIRADASDGTAELGGVFEITARAFPDKPLAEMEKLIREALTEFESRGATDDDLLRFKASHESNVINSLGSVSGKASMLAAYQTFNGNANYLPTEMQNYSKVTKEDVMRVYNNYIKNKPAVILSVYPKGKPELIAKPNNFTPPTSGNTMNQTNYEGLEYKKAKDKFDRNQKPVPGVTPLVSVPDYWTETFQNGLKVIGAKNTEIPSVSIQLSVEAGHKMEMNDFSKAGIAQFTASLMNEASQNMTAEAFSDKIEKLGSSISVGSDNNYISVYISSQTKNLDATLKLAEEKIFHPKFDSTDFARLKKQQIEAIANQATQATSIANNVYSKILYGKDNILGVPAIGTTESVSSISLEDVRNYYKKYFVPGISNLVIVGDVEKLEILPKMNFLKQWTGKEVKVPVVPASAPVAKSKIYLVNKDNAPQSEIRIGYLALPYDATGEYFKAGIMNYVLGGAFSSRINLNLREDKGWTYGARSGFFGDKTIGAYSASAGVRADASDSSIVEFMKEIRNFADKGITDEELDFTKKSIGQRDALKYETSGQKAGFLKPIVVYNLNKDFVSKQTEILKNIKKEEVNALAKKYLPYDNMAIVIVGDSKKIKSGLSKLNYELVELDNDGNLKK